MIDPADLVAALRRMVATSGAPLPPEVGQMLEELSPKLGEADPDRFKAALAEALPELRAMQAKVGSAGALAAAGKAPPDPEQALAMLARLSEAWTRRDGESVDAILGELEPESEETERLKTDARDAIAAQMAGFRMKPLGEV